LKIALIGYGKMGKAIEQIALERGHSVIMKIDVSNAADLTADNLRQADAAIEFTGPEAAFGNIMQCIEAGVPVVSGSTGWLARKGEVEKACENSGSAFLYASNFSIGVNIFFALNKKLATLMAGHPEYDISMEEIHHTEKKDSPSGTAISLAEQILDTGGKKKKWVNRESDDPSELIILSKRIDPAPGTHSVTYHSEIDDIEIKHTAHSRKGFAAGAVLAAEFIAGKKGIFSMEEVLGIK
jgi:4-hydroxy-tetrahydrodipicolinate reductase